MQIHHKVVIVGGGNAGLTVGAQLAKKINPADIAIIEPSSKHYYQPLWTLIGGGVFPREESERNEADFMPKGVHWIKSAVTEFAPATNSINASDGKVISYDYLIVAAGIQIDWDRTI